MAWQMPSRGVGRMEFWSDGIMECWACIGDFSPAKAGFEMTVLLVGRDVGARI